LVEDSFSLSEKMHANIVNNIHIIDWLFLFWRNVWFGPNQAEDKTIARVPDATQSSRSLVLILTRGVRVWISFFTGFEIVRMDSFSCARYGLCPQSGYHSLRREEFGRTNTCRQILIIEWTFTVSASFSLRYY
jgi:hypothetical protein